MGNSFGFEGHLYRNVSTDPDPYENPTWSEITNVGDLTLTVEPDKGDGTTRASGGFKATAPGLFALGLEFEMNEDPTDADLIAIRAAFFARGTVEIVVMFGKDEVDDVGAQGIRATMAVFKAIPDEKLADLQKVPIGMEPAIAAHAPEVLTVGSS